MPASKRDSTALVAVTFDKKTQCVRLVAHRVFTPTPGDPIDFEATVERTLLDWRKRFRAAQVLFDPYPDGGGGAAAGEGARPDRGVSADDPEPDGGHVSSCST